MTQVFSIKRGKMFVLPKLYTKSASGRIVCWQCHAVNGEIVTRWGELGGKEQVASFACKPKNAGRSNATTAEEQAVAEAKAMWQKRLKKKYYQTVEEAEGSERIKPMLAQDYHKHAAKVKWPVLVQVKLDGLRCLARMVDGNVVLQSRGGDFFDIEHIRKAVAAFFKNKSHDLVLDGEIYCHGMSLQNIVSHARVYDESKTQLLRYVVYDVFNPKEMDLGFDARHAYLTTLEAHTASGYRVPVVSRLHTGWCVNHGALMEHLKEATGPSQGFEGVMVRDPNSPYRAGYRSPGLLKLKSFDEKEYKIIGYRPGKGKAKDVPIFECQLKGDVTFEVVPSGTHAERAEMLKNADKHLGKWLTVRHWGLTDAGKPKFPIGVLIRGKKAM